MSGLSKGWRRVAIASLRNIRNTEVAGMYGKDATNIN